MAETNKIICRCCGKQTPAMLRGEGLPEVLHIRACTECEKYGLVQHALFRKKKGLPTVSFREMRDWQDEMIRDFVRQMKGLSAKKLIDPADKGQKVGVVKKPHTS